MKKDHALVVENYSDLLMVIAETLRERHYRCDAVRDADEAIEKLKTIEYGSILLDVTWPVMTNPVIRFLQQEKPDLLKTVIVMTAFDPRYLGMEQFEEICTFLRKPFGIDELFERLSHCAPDSGRSLR